MSDNLQTIEPTKLCHYIVGRLEGPNHFRWEGGCLIYKLHGEEHSVIPTASQWEEFWSVCDGIEIWSWPQWLGDRHTIDGLPWSTEIQVGTRSVTSRGQLVGSPPGLAQKLLCLHRALQALTGWQPSGEDSLFVEGIESTNLALRSRPSGVPWHLRETRRRPRRE